MALARRPGQFSNHDHNYGRPCTLTMGEMIVKGRRRFCACSRHGIAVISNAGRELESVFRALTEGEEKRQGQRDVSV